MRNNIAPSYRSGVAAAVVLLLSCALLAAGCGDDDDPRTLSGGFDNDGKALAKEVEEAAQIETGDQVDVTCPPSVEISDGEHIDCEAAVGGAKRKVRVSKSDGVYRWNLYDFLDPEKVEDEIERDFKRRLSQVVTAECRRVPIERDEISFCTASTAQREYRIRVRQTDDFGGIVWHVEEPPPAKQG
jgi:Domain of unknown function (DUF4333)